MDPITGIGFALGAGSFLFDVFDKAVEAYKLYSTAKSLGKVSAHLVAKLLIEECRLKEWGEGVHIRPAKPTEEKGSEPAELHRRLRENDALYQAVLQALAGIEDTLTDINGLTVKYGLSVFEEDNAESQIVLPIRPGAASGEVTTKVSSETSKNTKERGRAVQASTSFRKKFRWAIKDQKGFEALLERVRYYNDSLYCLLPRDSVDSIRRDVLANLIGSATSERLLQYSAVAQGRDAGSNISEPPHTQYASIASAAEVGLHMAKGDQAASTDMWIEERFIRFDDRDSCVGTFSRDGSTPVRVFVEKLRYIPYGTRSEDSATRELSLERIKDLARLLREPHRFGFATMPCLGVISDLMEYTTYNDGKMNMVYQIPEAADPLGEPVSLHDLLTKDEFRREEPPDIDVRFKLVSSLANALHEMHCTGWLHRNISSKNIHFLKVKDGDGVDSLDLGKPYATGFDAARAFVACGSVSAYRSDLAAAPNQHPGYIMYKYWSQQRAEDGNTGDKLFYMPRHDYYSMGLVFLEIGMWQSLESMLLKDVSYMYEDNKVGPDSSLEEIFKALEGENMFIRQGMFEEEDEEDPEGHPRREALWSAYLADGPRLAAEECLTDFVLDQNDLEDSGLGATWAAWDAAYGSFKLRQDALKVCAERLGARMGKRYREAVRRCVATEFGVDPKANNADWLRTYNWKVVQDLAKCCA